MTVPGLLDATASTRSNSSSMSIVIIDHVPRLLGCVLCGGSVPSPVWWCRAVVARRAVATATATAAATAAATD